MLGETSQKPSAIRKFEKDDLMRTNQLNNSSKNYDLDNLGESNGSNTLKFLKNSFEPIESELKRIRDILDKEK